VVVSSDLRIRMMKLWQPAVGVWKRNVWRKHRPEWRPTSSFLMEKYAREHRESVFDRLGGNKRGRSPEMGRHYASLFQPPCSPGCSVGVPRSVPERDIFVCACTTQGTITGKVYGGELIQA
jgi:hypothetical protein